MRQDTPPRSSSGDDDIESQLEARMEFNAMLEAEGVLIDDIESDFYEDIDDDELEEVELEELQRRLNERNDAAGDNEDDMDNGIGEMRATPEDKALFTFKEHSSPIFSCHIHPEHDIAVTGGQDDVAYVWNLEDGHVIDKITDHSDTVTATKFSHDGNYLVTGDMAGIICVFKLQIQTTTTGNVAVAVAEDLPDSSSSSKSMTKPKITLNKMFTNAIGDMSWCFWHDRANVLFAGSSETGEIYMWRIPSGDCKVLVGPGSCCAAAELTDGSKKLYASYNDGSVRLWDLRAATATLCITDQHSKELVPSVACDPNGALYVSGDRDGKILFSTQNGPIQSVQVNSLVECLAFSPSIDLKMLASATLEGETTIWDCVHFIKRVTCAQPEDGQSSICSMKWLNAHTLAVGTADGDILIYDARSGAIKHKLTGHRAHIYEFFYCRRTNTLLSVSEDTNAKLFTLPELDE